VSNNEVITRFAPSPTGFLHIGGVRTALFAYLFAKQNKGKYILRIEDTDTARNRKEWMDGIVDDMAWLGLNYDEFAIVSDRVEIHKKSLQKLIENGFAYVSKEVPLEEGQRDEVIRFRNPNKKIKFNDLIRGEVEFDTTDLGDFIIARSISEPLYHLAVVVDDIDMNVTHIIRAEEHISNTPRQILIAEALGAKRPLYAHLPLVLAKDRSKLSKRKHGEAVSLSYYRKLGYLPNAILNYLALVGWNPGTEQEIFSMNELIEQFRLEKIQKGGAIFDVEKLNWFNREHLKMMSQELRVKNYEDELEKAGLKITDKNLLERIEPVITDRINKFSDIKDMVEKGEIQFFFGRPEWKKEKFLWKGEGDFADVKRHLAEVSELLSKISGPFDHVTVKSIVWPYAEKEGRGSVLWPVRYALSGLEKSPDPFSIASILGKEETVNRLVLANQFLADEKNS
jgi:glutamyl-tRNA synthetase